MLKIGGHVFPAAGQNAKDPELLARLAKEMGYTAAYAPDYLTIDKPDEIRAARRAFEKEGIVIAEAGYWENMLDLRPEERKKNREEMCRVFAMAEELGAGCVVNTAGSYCEGPGYQNHHPKNFTEAHFEDAVEMARYLIDMVKPKRTYFTYEVFMYNSIDCPEQYARILKAVDREKFGAHIDLTNMMRSPRELYMAKDLTDRCVRLFPEKIISAHIKDARLKRPAITTIIEEAVPGEGEVDLAAFLKGFDSLPHMVTMMMEHYQDAEEYSRGLRHLKALAAAEGIVL